ncbi:MAG: phenylacetate--CoA ligase family protein [Chloroflexota bacterium]|nr:MAG: phenylacetate--CoA ligase family protein [Chloroflexota bacterium]
MDAALLARVLWHRWRLAQREHWTRDQLRRHQERSLATLRGHACAQSRFYRELHRGRETAPLDALPTVTKAELMERFDDAVTDPRVRRADLEAHLRTLRGDELYLGRYRLNATSGSTGEPGLFLFDPYEWSMVLVSFARGPAWAGCATGLTHRAPTAIVASTGPSHMSARAGASFRSPMVPTLRLDATRPMAELVAELNAFAPRMLVGYASMIRQLADEQVSGRLGISPGAVFTSSEALTEDARRRIESAWGKTLFDQYAATETAGIAAECRAHRGKHLFEDMVLAEVVDERNHAVPPGTFGAKVLVTVLWSRTVPLIRYELNDSVRLADEPCLCGRPFRLVDAVQGRTEDLLRFVGADGQAIAVQPLLFHHLMDGQPVAAWRVVQVKGGIRVQIVDPAARLADASLATVLRDALRRQGMIDPMVTVERLPTMPTTRNGKSPLIVALPGI